MNFVTLAWESTLVLLAVGPMRRSEGGYGVMPAAGARCSPECSPPARSCASPLLPRPP
ncbi:hypothetical protein [Nonomuraea sp. KM88]|uniref:hypothetical protein n=1 Tax=Nonomuraea sp. KM88 TaxID=3457427 RepID=UPI003FCC5CB0